jgi:hypothetical protein
VEPISPWSRNPDPADVPGADDDVDVDVVDDVHVEADRPRPAGLATLPGERVRRGALVVRWSAVLVTAISVLGSALTTYGVGDESFSPYGDGWAQFGQFLSGVSWSIGFAALVLAASYGLTALAARLDLDRALADR